MGLSLGEAALLGFVVVPGEAESELRLLEIDGVIRVSLSAQHSDDLISDYIPTLPFPDPGNFNRALG